MFVVGGTYENRLGRYTVLAIKGKWLEVRYEDGTSAVLDTDRQERIVSNLRKEREVQEKSDPVVRQNKSASSRPAVEWTRYNLWNRSIFDRYFSEDAFGRLVYIDIDDQETAGFAPDDQATKAPVEDLVQAVIQTLDFRKGHLLDRHFERLAQWKQNDSPAPPPFIAVLALFCLVAQRMHGDEQFTASNYYDRLAQTLLGVGYSDEQKNALWSGFQRAYLLWNEFEVWLSENGGRYGVPSAQPMYGLSHVGYPISQSLLRSQDRQKLAEFFGEEGLVPGHHVPPGDMERLMGQWVPKSSLSQAAKTSWKNGAARRRMAEVASLELVSWDGTLPAVEHTQRITSTSPIAIETRILGGPKPRLTWGIVFRMPPDTPLATFDVGEDGTGLPVDGAYLNSVTVARGLGERWSEPVTGVSIADFLLTPVTMIGRGSQSKSIWQPRKVIVLTWDDELKVYRTQRHLEFGRRGIVMAYRTIATKVSEVLAPIDAGGMSQLPESWGVPQDWIVFKDVQLTRVPETGQNPDLDVLVPEIWSSVEWEGGVAFPGRKQWLFSRLPTVRINSIDEVQRMRLDVDRKSTLDPSVGTSDSSVLESYGNAADIDLATLDLIDGAYGLTITAYRNERDKSGENLARQTFEIRSPDSPLARGPEMLSHRSDKLSWTLSAASGLDRPDGSPVNISGALIQPESDLPSSAVGPPDDLGSTSEANPEDLLGPEKGIQRTFEGIADCFKGAHYFILPTVHTIGGNHQPATGVCKRCGLKKVFRPIRWSQLLSRESTRPQLEQSNEPVLPNMSMPTADAPDLGPPDYDGLLEACLTAGGGSWPNFELLARQVSNTPAFAHEAVQLFSALGYIDVELDSSGRHPRQWKVAPSTLVSTAYDHLYLSGYRSTRLVHNLKSLVQDRGGEFTAVPSSDGPTAYWIKGLGEESTKAVVDTVNRNATLQLAIANRPDRSITMTLVPLLDVLAQNHRESGPVMASPFDVTKASWATSTLTDFDGLFRTDSTPRSYLLRSGGSWYEVSYRTGKHLAGMFAGKSLLAYNVQSEQLECPLGAQLPGLYERAVVLSSGLPPVIDLPVAKVIYRQVPMDVASAVWAAIYGSGKPKG